MAYSWNCPSCGTHTTLQKSDYKVCNAEARVETANTDQGVRFKHVVIKCPNVKCGQFAIDVEAAFFPLVKDRYGDWIFPTEAKAICGIGPGSFRFTPRVGRPLSSYAPAPSTNDYNEACLIKDLSPKAAATLCRRALQGMIRDFWSISKPKLADELLAIEEKCDPALYAALMSLKGVGNIGAHPERDINLIVDVEPGEVDELLELLRMLDAEWYVARQQRAERLASIAEIGANKKAQQKGLATAVVAPAPQSGS